jgi:hypothetical protein
MKNHEGLNNLLNKYLTIIKPAAAVVVVVVVVVVVLLLTRTG